MMLRLLLVFCVLLEALPASSRAENASSSSFTSAISLSKIPPQVFWSIHQQKCNLTGEFDMQKFIKIAHQEGPLVSLHFVPYDCMGMDYNFQAWSDYVRETGFKVETNTFKKRSRTCLAEVYTFQDHHELIIRSRCTRKRMSAAYRHVLVPRLMDRWRETEKDYLRDLNKFSWVVLTLIRRHQMFGTHCRAVVTNTMESYYNIKDLHFGASYIKGVSQQIHGQGSLYAPTFPTSLAVSVVHAFSPRISDGTIEPHILLVASWDGEVYGLDHDSKQVKWVFSTGSYLASHKINYKDDIDLRNRGINHFNIEPNQFLFVDLNFKLTKYDKLSGIQSLPASPVQYMLKTPYDTVDGLHVIGMLSMTTFYIDYESGAVLYTFVSMLPLSEFSTDNSPSVSPSREVVRVTRTDYSFVAYDEKSGRASWIVSIAEMTSMFNFLTESITSHIISRKPKVESSWHNTTMSLMLNGNMKKADVSGLPSSTYAQAHGSRDESSVISEEDDNLLAPCTFSPWSCALVTVFILVCVFLVLAIWRFLGSSLLQGKLCRSTVGSLKADNFTKKESLEKAKSQVDIEIRDKGLEGVSDSSRTVVAASIPRTTNDLLLEAPFQADNSETKTFNEGFEDGSEAERFIEKESLESSNTNSETKIFRENEALEADAEAERFYGKETLENSSTEAGVQREDNASVFVSDPISGKFTVANALRIKEAPHLIPTCENPFDVDTKGMNLYRAKYDERLAVIKRCASDQLSNEYKNLCVTDYHPNIIRAFCEVKTEEDGCMSLGLESYQCNLHDLVSKDLESLHKELWINKAFPSQILLNLMRDMVTGLSHLHTLEFIHMDLQPKNIWICKWSDKCFHAKISNMGSSRHFSDTTGITKTISHSIWQAPEQLQNHGHLTSAVDIFSLGCVFFFCLTKGCHPFISQGKSEDDIVNSIKVGQRDLFKIQEMVEAHDLIKKSLSSTPEERPSAKDILQHPFFWNAEERLSFMAHVSEYVEKGEPTDLEAELNMLQFLSNIVPATRVHEWKKKIPPDFFISDIHNRDRPIYTYGNTVCGLLRFIRNKFIHFATIKDDIKEQIGIQSVEALTVFFGDLFPNLLIHVHMVASEKLSHDKYFSKYFSND